MKNSLFKQLNNLKQKYKSQSRWKKVVSILGCAVVFVTTYALILPAITMERNPQCGLEEHAHTAECYETVTERECICTPETLGVHQHTPECYDADGNLICGYADYVIHTHDESCYDKNGSLICTLPEIKPHQHTAECYETRRVLVCGKEESPGHTHGPECYTRTRGELICGMEEMPAHHHDESCYTVEKVLTCTEDHEHTEECYEERKVLTCGLEETEGHTHTDECYEWHDELTCGLEECEGHTHTEECYEDQQVLICGQQEIIPHIHSESCYDENGSLICGMLEVREHVHGPECFAEAEHQKLICGKQEHQHTDACYPDADPKADSDALPLSEQTLQVETENAVVTVSGLLPEGAVIKAVPTQVEMENAQVLLALDITIVLPDGTIYEPEKDALSVEISSPEIADEGCGVYYVPEIGVPEALPAENAGGSVAFETPHFSTYAVVYAAPPTEIRVDGGEVIDPDSGKTSGLKWEITKDQQDRMYLKITGKGAIPAFGDSKRPPWYNLYSSKKLNLVLGDGVTAVGKCAFKNMAFESIDFGPTVSDLGEMSFGYAGKPNRLVIPGTVKQIQKDTFLYGNELQEVVLEEGIEVIGNNALGVCRGNVHLPASLQSFGSYAVTGNESYSVAQGNTQYAAMDGVLYSKDMTRLLSYPDKRVADEYCPPASVTVIENGAVAGVATVRRLVVPNTVTTIKGRLAAGSAYEEIYFADGMNPELFSDTNQHEGLWFYSTSNLRQIRWPEDIPIVLGFADFYWGNFDALETYTMPEQTVRVSAQVQGMNGSFAGMHTLTCNAKNAQFALDRTLFPNSNYQLIIGPTVDHLDAGFRYVAETAHSMLFRGPNQITVDPGAFDLAPMPFNGVSGKLWVDEQGLVYTYDDQNGAELIYVPAGLQTVQIPARITPENEPIAVCSVRKDALKYAQGLSSLKFDAPKNITLEPYALANCPTLTSVNSRKTVQSVTNLFQSVGSNALYNTGLTGASNPEAFEKDMSGHENLTVTHRGATDMTVTVASAGGTMKWTPNTGKPEQGGYHLLTGDTMTLTASAGNTEGKDKFEYRLYLKKNADDCSLSVVPGTTYTFDGQTAECCGTTDPNVIYLAFSPEIGSTMSIPVTVLYPSPDSAGGGFEAWGVITEKNGQKGEILESAEGSIQAVWKTLPDPFELIKTDNNVPEIQLKGMQEETADGEKYMVVRPADNINWKIELKRALDASSAFGKDYASSAEFTDVLTLPKGMYWDTDLIQAVQAGNIRYSRGALYMGKKPILSMGERSGVVGLRLSWDEAQGMRIHWNWINSDTTAEINSMSLVMSLNLNALYMDMDVFDPDTDSVVHNKVDAKIHYRHSPDRALTKEASKTIGGSSGKIELEKTASPTAYFGEDITYTLRLHNDGGLPWRGEAGSEYRLHDAMSDLVYMKPENLQRMLDEAEEKNAPLTVTISNASLAPWAEVTGVDGSTNAFCNVGNTGTAEQADTPVTLVLTKQKKTSYAVTVQEAAQSFTGRTVEEALRSAGYADTRKSQYVFDWVVAAAEDEFVMQAGEERVFTIPATIKTSFALLSLDEPNYYPSENAVWVNNSAVLSYRTQQGEEKNIMTKNAGVSVRREAAVYKSLSSDGVDISEYPVVADGDLLDYTLTFDHFGKGEYKNLPMVDDLTGSQYLLVPTEGNAALKKLPAWRDEDGNTYYKLTEGSYRNVRVGTDAKTGQTLNAASVTVTRDTETGALHTQIKWYFPRLDGGDYRMQVAYKALVDFSLTGDIWTIGNKVWMNDKEDSRLYDALFGEGTILRFDKDIVTRRGITPDKDELVASDYTPVGAGEKVTYRLTLRNTGNSRYVLAGSNLADALPHPMGVFSWEKGRNVTGLDVVKSDRSIKTSGLDQWDISDEPYSGLIDDGRQYIRWPDTARIEFARRSALYIYVTLTYPSNTAEGQAAWDEYVAAAGGNRVDNTLYVYRYPSAVTHDLRETGKVLLQKGVAAVGWWNPNVWRTFNPAGSSRQYYNNKDSKERMVAYYVTLYNGGSNRLYLDTLHDCLPEGFTFHGLMEEGTSNLLFNGAQIITKGGANANIWGSRPLVNLPADTVYRSANIQSAGKDRVLDFRINAGEGAYAVKWDESRKQFYLDRHEAIVFGYTAKVGESKQTLDTATNIIGMYYTDTLNAGVEAIPTSQLDVSAAYPSPEEHLYADRNDGSREVMSSSQVSGFPGFPAKESGSWLISRVNMQRGGIVPGVTKYTESFSHEGTVGTTPYENSVLPDAIINWRVRLHNDGTLSLNNYIFTDVLPQPYEFTGKVTAVLYDGKGRELCTEPLFEILETTADSVKVKDMMFSSGAVSEIPLDGSMKELAGDHRQCAAAFSREESGNYVMKLELTVPYWSIPEDGGHLDILLSGKNTTSIYNNAVYINKALLTPAQQEFDSTNKGSLIRDESGKAVSVTNSAPVTVAFGYGTSSVKQVTENSSPENTAVSTDQEHNRILLKDRSSPFTYTLTVNNDTDNAMTQLVLIDNLPAVGDASPFDATAPRNSAFAVELQQPTNISAAVRMPDGTTKPLPKSAFTLQFSKTTDFGGPQSADWKGEQRGTKANWTKNANEARAFRLIIEDKKGTLIPPKASVEVTVGAVVGPDAVPGTVAWNSFGYHYTLKDIPAQLESMPLVVGVQIPSVPQLCKELVDQNGALLPAAEQQKFTFEVSDGTPKGTKTVTLTVPRGRTKSCMLLDATAMGKDWIWQKGARYTIREILPENEARWEMKHWQGGIQLPDGGVEFLYEPSVTAKLVCTNAQDRWALELIKADSVDGQKLLDGAVFALYSPSEADAMPDDAYQALEEKPERKITRDEETWYLADVQTTAEGKIHWQGLTHPSYYLEEIKAPDGYYLDTQFIRVSRSDAVVTVTVENTAGYALPSTGGSGTLPFALAGLALMAAALLGLIHLRHKGEGRVQK